MRILVTGASGLIGKALVERFRAEDHEVHSSSRREVNRPKHHVADLEVPAQAQSLVARVLPRTIVHLAGSARGIRHELYGANTLTAINILWAAGALPHPPHIVLLGSAAEYGEGSGHELDETAPLLPVSDYGRAKVAATTLAEVLAERRGLGLAIARPFNVVSNRLPGSTPLGNLRQQLIAQSGSRRLVRCGRLDIVRDFVPLDFVVEALARMAFEELSGTYNICSGVGISLGSILEAMTHRLGVEADVQPLPELLAIPAADRVVGDPSKLSSLGLAVHPSPDSLAETCLDR